MAQVFVQNIVTSQITEVTQYITSLPSDSFFLFDLPNNLPTGRYLIWVETDYGVSDEKEIVILSSTTEALAGEVSRIDTHAADALARLLEQYKRASNVQSLVRISAERTQQLENFLYGFVTRYSLELVSGKLLDEIGGIVGQPRGNAILDVDYRRILKGRILANASTGSIESINSVFLALTGASVIDVEEGSASVTIYTNVAPPEDLRDVLRGIVKAALAAGVGLGYTIQAEAIGAFGFSTTDMLETEDPTTEGFGDLSDPTEGGILATIIF